MTGSETDRTIAAVWRIEAARLIARLARIVGDVGVAEDLAQDALGAALERWPESGVPDHPGAWLMATAKHRAIDDLRRLLPSVRGDLLARLGRLDEARAEFERAAALTRNAPERKLLLERTAGCACGSSPSEPR
jgi:predicted RNA polymerase sigma factor